MNYSSRTLLAVVLMLFMCFGTSQVQGKPQGTFRQSPYSYRADDVFIGKVLKDFARSFGVQLVIDTKLSGKVNSRIRTNSAAAFLNRLGLEYGFNWFLYSNTLYITESQDHQVYRLDVAESSTHDLKLALENIGLLDPRFGWGELPDEGIVLVSGPKRYVDLVKKFSRPSLRAMNKKKKSKKQQEVMVFPLKYASVTDREVRYRNEHIVIPGVTSLIKELLSQDRNPALNEVEHLYNLNQERILRQTQSIEGGDQMDISPYIMGGSRAPETNSVNNVSADVRSNSVLIYDDLAKRSMYQRLIEKLDKPSRMVEIDAIILDIERKQLSQIGVNWGYQKNDFSLGSMMPQGGVQTATLFIQDKGRFYAELQALEMKGKATVLANPSVLTMANQPAVIDSSETAFIQTEGERVVDVREVTAGTGLQVVPRILTGGGKTTIQLNVDIEDGNIFEEEDKETPSVNRSTISTQALVTPEQSLVFGGFNVSENTRSTSKVPVLGDIPLLGSLFQVQKEARTKRVRLFILTPRILDSSMTQDVKDYVQFDEDRDVVANAQEEIKRRRHGKQEALKVDVGDALRSLIKGYIPNGFEKGKLAEPHCRKDVILAKFAKDDQYIGPEFNIIAGTIYNPSSGRQRYDEKNCASQGVLAVSAWPSTLLEPGEKAEIFVVTKPSKTNETQKAPELHVKAKGT
ncbi:type III secretion system outer membrane ring subunit SctC [Vibrio coralliilyticus]|uniref:Type 3 secretion system secretin n=1 Tax=Vibrio coralliilyticus TaxID=190893 RepID=A0AAP6ZU53_9VIBR|nr:type III secretion system outer membrane ring subunit SctC [Vibrio coralliilyticus]NOJ24254.1 EscC/YscC/HrcC family type III secretion system outer membrane ring protein [Vibrio coralliilyticus]